VGLRFPGPQGGELDASSRGLTSSRARLADAPELEATTLFEDLLRRKPDGYTPGQLRTLQRRLKQWRAQEGPPKRIFFPQVHRPGEAMQTDFTWASTLGITIGGEPFPHLLCHLCHR